MHEFAERAVAIGGAMAEEFQEFLKLLDAQPRPASTVCVEAVMAAVETRPELNDTGFLSVMFKESLHYTQASAPAHFRVALELALERCTPQGIKLAAAVTKLPSIRHGSEARMRPGVCDSLAIMVQLARAGLFPSTDEAYLNCLKLLIMQSVPWAASSAVERAIRLDPDTFKRAASEPMDL